MYAIYFCTVHQHLLRFVLLAAIVCLVTATSSILMFRRAHARGKGHHATLAGAAIGLGAWATHFVAMLGYSPGVEIWYRVVPTLLSLLVSIMALALATHLAHRRAGPVGSIGAALLATGGIGAMHYLGTAALTLPVKLGLAPGYVCASLLLGMVPLCAAFALARRDGPIWQPCLLLTLGVSALHFTGMAAIRLTPQRLPDEQAMMLSSHAMSLLAGFAASVVSGILLATVAAERRLRHAMHRSERDFSILVKGISDCALYMLTPEGNVASWNAGAARLKGYSQAEAIGMPLANFHTPEDRLAGRPAQALAIAAETGKFNAEGWRCRKDGSRFWAHVTIERIHDAGGRAIGFAKITRDMTRWKEDQDRLAETKAQLDTALANMHQGLAQFAPDGTLLLHNRRMLEIWGLSGAAISHGMPLAGLLEAMAASGRPGAGPDVRATLEQALGGPLATPMTVACNDSFVVSVASRPVPTGGWVVTFEDITERRRNEERIAHMALHDTLTGLPNRTRFGQWCDHEMPYVSGHRQRFAVVAIDLDGFKEINDCWGHAEGDRALATVAERLQACCGDGEIVARLGGDEFAAAAIVEDDAALADFVARLGRCFDEPAGGGRYTVPVAASFGVAVFPEDGHDLNQLMNNADLAMYRAKSSLHSRICYYQPEMDEAARTRRQIASELRAAVELDQFRLLYQPQHVVRTGELVGYEALLRWHHPARGLVNPMDFITIAEETGEIFGIGEWVLREAAREAATWPDSLKVAVNLSPVQLLQGDLVPKIMAILFETGLPASRLELEITESAIIADKARALHMLRQIKALGITIAMDDFGTGYSSLDTLHSFPFDKIKIDKSFLQQSSISAQAAAIVRAVLALGRSLDIPVLAEGVETDEQAGLLAQEGCQQAQGYLFGRPQVLIGGESPREVARGG